MVSDQITISILSSHPDGRPCLGVDCQVSQVLPSTRFIAMSLCPSGNPSDGKSLWDAFSHQNNHQTFSQLCVPHLVLSTMMQMHAVFADRMAKLHQQEYWSSFRVCLISFLCQILFSCFSFSLTPCSVRTKQRVHNGGNIPHVDTIIYNTMQNY